jgi:hypothetical protein
MVSSNYNSDSEPIFWEWLANNTAKVKSDDDEKRERITDDLSDTFHKAFHDLTWEIEVQEDDDWWFIISADGVPDRIDQVIQAVRNAPKITGWKIVAFRQRGSLDVSIQMHGRRLTYEDIWCKVEEVGWQANVVFHIAGLTKKTRDDLIGATFVLLDNAVGEFDSMVRLGEIDFQPLEKSPSKQERYFPLSDLPAYLDTLPDPNE